MNKPTALPKPEFIANVDTANEEIVRLVGQYNALIAPEGPLAKAEADLKAANDLLEDLQTAQAAATAAQAEVARLTVENKDLKTKADAAGAAAVAAIAASGVAAPATVTNDADAVTTAKPLYGLARALDATARAQAAKKKG